MDIFLLIDDTSVQSINFDLRGESLLSIFTIDRFKRALTVSIVSQIQGHP